MSEIVSLIAIQKQENDKFKEECEKLKQALQEIKEIANGMHDWWLNKDEYEDVYKLSRHLLGCELNRIIDEISEVEE